jgi:hypothetical protein
MPRGSISGTGKVPKVMPPPGWDVRVPDGLPKSPDVDRIDDQIVRPGANGLVYGLRERLAALIKPD